MHTYTHTHTHTYIRTYMRVQSHTHTHTQVHVPKASGVEPEFVAFLLEASQDCVPLGVKGNTLTVYRCAPAGLEKTPALYFYLSLRATRSRSKGAHQWGCKTPAFDAGSHALLACFGCCGGMVGVGSVVAWWQVGACRC